MKKNEMVSKTGGVEWNRDMDDKAEDKSRLYPEVFFLSMSYTSVSFKSCLIFVLSWNEPFLFRLRT